MSIIRRNNNDMFPAFFNDFITKDLWNWGVSNNSSTNTTIPAVNIRETNENYVVEMAAPGMMKNDFKIELDGNNLTITSEKESRNDEKDDQKYSRQEFRYDSFQRTFQLPRDVVDSDKIEAKYENGLLHLVIS